MRLLITSRCQLGSGLQGATQLHLASLTEEDAVTLLCNEAGAQAPSVEQAVTLAGVCGRNALALTIIGGFIACQRVTAEVGIGSIARCDARCGKMHAPACVLMACLDTNHLSSGHCAAEISLQCAPRYRRYLVLEA